MARTKPGMTESKEETPRSIMSLFAKPSTYDEPSARLAGIGLMLLSILCFRSAMRWKVHGRDLLGRAMLWLRACAALIVLLPMVWRHRAQFMRSSGHGCSLARDPVDAGSRGVLPRHGVSAARRCRYLYLACPIFVTALSAIVLREHVGWRRWSAILIGFAGC